MNMKPNRFGGYSRISDGSFDRQILGRKFRSTIDELRTIAEVADVPVRRCPPKRFTVDETASVPGFMQRSHPEYRATHSSSKEFYKKG